MKTHQNHPFHLVDSRPWPLTGSIGAITITSGIVIWFHQNNIYLFIIGVIIILITIVQWWRDITREGTFQGHHTIAVSNNLKWGIILFIVSEVFFFISFFWGFFHRRLAPTIEIGINWPPAGIKTFNPIQIPLLNTMVLLCSGLTVTWAHHSLIDNQFRQTTQALFITVILGIYFTILQAYEYIESRFNIRDSVYGSRFFIATGFHGIHVIIGTTFLLVCLIRHIIYHFSSKHHFGFEAAAWYWHFVDVVWLFLYISIYWWGSYPFSIKSIFDFQSKGLKQERIMFKVLNRIFIVIAIRILLIIVCSIISSKSIIDREKITPFECGFDPKRSPRIPFSIQFFLIAVLFLIFDVEIVIIIPIILTIKKRIILYWIITVITFIIILIAGLFHEWKNGILEWTD